MRVDGISGGGIATTTIPAPAAPWELDWQVDATTTSMAPDLFALIGFTGDALFSNGFEPD